MGTDNNLFHQIKHGDKQSFELLFKSHYAPLCSFANNYIKDKDDCEEIVQTFFLKLWERKSEIDINTSIKNYMFSSVRNSCLNYIKHQKIKASYQTEILYTNNLNDNIYENFLEVDLIHKIEKIIAELPDKRREIFILSREQGLKYREIADKLQISIKTVETQMGHALKDLRDKLKDYQSILITFFIIGNFMNKGK